ncbi:hypothetical protein BSKO_14095 [Bryopsis sp. KO-2023]|nr:hypothetical protein BSKO_14095 [Bryopsis sp. KO-2023]
MMKHIAVVFAVLMVSCALAQAAGECGATDDPCFTCHNPEDCSIESTICDYMDGESFYDSPDCICCHLDNHGIF